MQLETKENNTNPLETFFSSGKMPSKKSFLNFFPGTKIIEGESLVNIFALKKVNQKEDYKIFFQFKKYDLSPPENKIVVESFMNGTRVNDIKDEKYTISSFSELQRLKPDLEKFLENGTLEDIFEKSRDKEFIKTIPSLDQMHSLFPEAVIEKTEETGVFNLKMEDDKRNITIDFQEKDFLKVQLLESERSLEKEKDIRSIPEFKEFMKEWAIYLKDGIEKDSIVKCPYMKKWDGGSVY